MGDNIRVHGTIRRSKRLELAVAKIITEVRKHEEYECRGDSSPYRRASGRA